MKILKRSFYERNTVNVAKDLLGKVLVRQLNQKILSGIITETEAYQCNDPASHSYKGKTFSNRAMFEEVGHAYIYFIYGNHFCLNAVAHDKKILGGGVLLRSILPTSGIDIMLSNRNNTKVSNLTNGPGKLAQALSITKNLYGIDLTKEGELYIIEGIKIKNSDIKISTRIGISKAKDQLWRFSIDLPL